MHVASRVECIVGKMTDDVTVLSCHSYLACMYGCFLRSSIPTCACFHLEHFSQLVYGEFVLFFLHVCVFVGGQ